MNSVPQDLFSYAVDMFRQLHMYPEIGFELPKTAALVAKELESMGISCTDRYGKCSVVAQIGNREDVPTLAIRADMDALPVSEVVDVPYASRHEGIMHACGHDSHTAILLAVAKVLKQREKDLPCNVRLLFQPSEEGAISGAKMMVENGCLDGVNAVICTHTEATMDANTIGVCAGDYMAACIPIKLCFHGISSHATLPENGVDAIAMAVEAYGKLKEMVKHEAQNRTYIWSVGQFTGGEVHNVICDQTTLLISFRYYDEAFAMRVMEKARIICQEVADSYGGSMELEWHISTGAVHNDEKMTQQVCRTVEALDGIKLVQMPQKKSSEDFAWYLQKVPGVIFRFGSGNRAKGWTATAHRPDFRVDEEGMKAAILTFVNFALNYDENNVN